MHKKQRPAILLIDDMPVNLQVLTAALSADFQVQIATSGAMGLTLAVKRPPDLILLDVMMPEMDGFEVCRRLKTDPVLLNVPVIFLTAMSVGASESVGLSLGAADYITKPIDVEIARLRIGNLLEREGLRREVVAQRDALGRTVEQLTQTAALLQQARQRELDAGNFIQRTLLQGEMPQGIEGVCFANFSSPSQGVDGVTEARNALGELFGLSRLSSLFEAGTRGPSCSCATQIEAIRQALQLFSDNAQVPDDQTLFMIELADEHRLRSADA